MNLEVNIDTKTLESFLTLAVQGFERSVIELERATLQLGELLSPMIIEAITNRHPIGAFMGPRTKVTVTGADGTVLIRVDGIPEATSGVFQYNLWEDQEFGYNTGDVEDKYMAWDFPRGSGQDWTHITHRKGVEVTRWVGQVQRILLELEPEIQVALKSLVGMAANKQVAAVITGASGGTMKTKPIMSSFGVTPAMGVIAVTVNYPSMQVNYHGSGGQFMAAIPLGLPTTAKGIMLKGAMRQKNIKITK